MISVVNTVEEVEVVVEQGECIVNPENFLALAEEIEKPILLEVSEGGDSGLTTLSYENLYA